MMRLIQSFIFALLEILIIPSLLLLSPAAHAGRMRGRPGNNAYPKVIDKALKAAAKCTPKVTAKEIKFCSGFKVTTKEVDLLAKGGANSCIERIKSHRFDVIRNNDAGRVPAPEWKAFTTSAQSASTFTDLRIVALKPNSDFVDCVHEWIHVLQNTVARDKLLAPQVREREFRAVEKSVYEQSDRVEALEKEGLKAHAIIQAGKAQQAIDRLREYRQLSDTLDESEAQFFVLQFCERLNCTSDDRENALANLYKRKEFLSPKFRTEIESRANGSIDAKKRTAIEEATKIWKPLDDSKASQIAEQSLKADWETLLKDIKKEGLRVVHIENAAPATVDVGEMIPNEILNKLANPTSEDMRLAHESKLLTGSALTKFTCTNDAGDANGANYKPAILITANSTRASLVHELLRFKQKELNPNYCTLIFGQREIDAALNRGELDRSTHDHKLLLSQALNALSEKAIYTLLLKFRTLVGKPETLNNELMLSSYESWLSTKP